MGIGFAGRIKKTDTKHGVKAMKNSIFSSVMVACGLLAVLASLGAGLVDKNDRSVTGNWTFENNVTMTGTKVTVSGGMPRAQLATDSQVNLGYSVYALKNPNGTALVATESGACFNLSVSSGIIKAIGEVCDNETEVSDCNMQVVLPENYVSGGSITVAVRCALIKTGSPVDDASTIDLVAYKQADGAKGSDLCATAAATFAALDTWYTKSFTITPTGLVAGDKLNLFFTGTVKDTEAGGGTIILNIDAVNVLVDVKG